MFARPILCTAALILIASGCDDIMSPDTPFDAEPSFAKTTTAPGKIVFARAVGGISDIYIMRQDGSDAVNLTQTSTADERDPVLSPDGSMVAYERNGNIWTMTVSGANQQLVYGDGSAVARQPAWSPDGTEIAFTRAPNTVGEDSDIYVVDVATGTAIPLLGFWEDDDQHSPTYHPTTGGVTYVERENGTLSWEIVGYNIQPGLIGLSPAWSPDGNVLLFHKESHYGKEVHANQQIYFMDVTEMPVPIARRVTFSEHDDTDPTWSWDGQKVAFARNMAPGAGAYAREIWLMEAGIFRAIAPLTSGVGDDAQPSWGPCWTPSERVPC